MKIYHYRYDTAEYTHTTEARLDPLEKKPLVPANATTTSPPDTGSDEVAVWNGESWSVEEDHRGQTAYRGWEVAGVVDYIGPILDGHSLVQADKPQSVLDAERIQEIKGELSALDRWLPRSVEDIIEAEEALGMASSDTELITYDKLSAENRDRLAQKLALRAELSAL